MNLNSWLHFVHVVAAMVWVGGGLMLSIVGFRARSRSRPEAIGDFARALPYVGVRVLMPSVVLVLVTGVWQVLASSAWKFTQLWVILALGLFGVAFLIGAVYLSGVGIALARAGSDDGPGREDAIALLNRWLAGYIVVLVVLLVIVWDMVFKPGL
jgi:uncharacterized membrane protein